LQWIGYVAQASVRGIALDACRIETEGEQVDSSSRA
jgi:hypothetical protein